MNIVFFGSSSDSVLVLEKLPTVAAVVTQPPRPVGRKQIMTPTPVEIWAKDHGKPVLSFPTKKEKPWEYENEQQVVDAVQPFKADLLVSASYGQKIPAAIIRSSKYGGLNVHPSILPRWRGGDPVPWAILSGDHQIGVTVVTIAESFDKGLIIAQKKIPITDKDMSDPLRTSLFSIGAQLLVDSMSDVISGKNKGTAQKIEGQPYAKRFSREDGFEPWKKIIDPAESPRINRKFRALHPWPGLWSLYNGKRIKILEFTHKPVTVQQEGKTPVSWDQFKTAYFSP